MIDDLTEESVLRFAKALKASGGGGIVVGDYSGTAREVLSMAVLDAHDGAHDDRRTLTPNELADALLAALTTAGLEVVARGRYGALAGRLVDRLEDVERRLASIIRECRDLTSGAEEDRGRDTILARIIAMAEGRE